MWNGEHEAPEFDSQHGSRVRLNGIPNMVCVIWEACLALVRLWLGSPEKRRRLAEETAPEIPGSSAHSIF